MLIRRPSDIRSSEITDERTYLRRRDFMRLAGSAAVAATAAPWLVGCGMDAAVSGDAGDPQTALAGFKPKVITTDEKWNTFEEITSYNNFYEFGTGKDDPARYAGRLKTSPWKVKIEGLCAKPAEYLLEDLIKPFELEERIYRLRCVEAWSMVIPWIGIPLSSILKRAEPTAKATFVEFTTLQRPSEMPGQNEASLRWPYTEGLRMDEAMHPLTIMAVGLYGKTLMNQNGAPFRLVVPWKYGFKSIKSVVRIRFVDKMPATAWSDANPSEYGFYSNVNPQVDHPRWSQARERRIGEFSRRPTLMFNGYGDQVASMYAGLGPEEILLRRSRLAVRCLAVAPSAASSQRPTASQPAATMLSKFSKPLVFLAALSPFLWLAFRGLTGRLSVNPIEDITLTTGIWALRFLLISLAITPIRRLTGWQRVIQYRRMLGLFAFFYATLHLLTYVVLDQGLAFEFIIPDILKRPYITMGMIAFTLMVPLAITSTKGWIRRLGKKWQLLHRLVYLSALAACIHFLWKVKVAIGEPVYYAAILGVLLAFRLLWRFRPTARPRRAEAGVSAS